MSTPSTASYPTLLLNRTYLCQNNTYRRKLYMNLDSTKYETMELLTPESVGKICQPTKLFPYTSQDTDVWDIIKKADFDPSNANCIRLIYTRYSIHPGRRGKEKDSGWNREHCWPKSLSNMPKKISSPGIGTDAHNLFCADPSINSTRQNKYFDIGGHNVIDRSPAPGYSGKTQSYTDHDSWEPPDAAKGVVARAILYMRCAYASHGLKLVENPQSDLEMGKLSVLLRWNLEYPPDDWERSRNRIIMHFQGNSNPFIIDNTLANIVDWRDEKG